jgi:LysM repeat protein
MASRYKNNNKIKLENGKRVYRSKIYPNIPLKDSDIYVVTQTGDRLDSLASQFYSNSSYWWIIATANNIHDASLSVDDGTILRIPIDYNTIVNNFNK